MVLEQKYIDEAKRMAAEYRRLAAQHAEEHIEALLVTLVESDLCVIEALLANAFVGAEESRDANDDDNSRFAHFLMLQ